ncbi:MAG: hypothetical protein INR68_12735 [Methylobacterium mesophilicum]|nr:hypothetical protein [Methylobacterium mesophilicum]
MNQSAINPHPPEHDKVQLSPGSGPVPGTDSRRLLRRLATIAWASILAGIALQTLLLVAKLAGGLVPSSAQVIVDFAQGVTWSFFVCAGIGIGTAIGKARETIGGLVGMVSAPLALGLARGVQKAVAGAVSAPTQTVIVSLAVVGVVRAVEYGILGWLLARLTAKSELRAGRYLGSGASVGIPFGAAMTGVTWFMARQGGIPVATPALVSTALNEMFFPVACSFVIYLAAHVGKLVSAVQEPAQA